MWHRVLGVVVKFAIVTVAAAMMLAGCNTSYNYFKEDVAEDSDRDTSLFGTALSMAGVIPEQQKAIEYKPRAPIAVPSTNELPTPGSSNTVRAAVNFPEDQDSAEARRRAELRSTLAYEGRIDEVGNNSNINLTADQMAAGRRAGGGITQEAWKPNQDAFGNTSANLTKEQLKTVVRAPRKGGEILEDDGSPAPRKYLIQPPSEYRTPAETAALPERKEIKNSDWARSRLYDVEDKTPRRLQQ